MQPDAASLDRLHDIVMPGPVPWWPPPPGWYVVLVLFLASLSVGLWFAWRRWQANAYRRAALRQLRALASAGNQPLVPAVSELLKRTALSAYPRPAVAGLSGSAWLEFLDRSSGFNDFAGAAGRSLLRAYDPQPVALTTDDRASLIAAARRWIANHRPPDQR